MGYFDGLTDGAFKTDAEGRHLFYPWGVFGTGYILEVEERYQAVRQFCMHTIIFGGLGLIAVLGIVGWWPGAAFILGFVLWYYFAVRRIIKDLQPSPERLGVAEAYRNSAKSQNILLLISMEIFTIAVLATGVWMLQSGENFLLAFAVVVFSGLTSFAIGYMILVKFRHR